MKVPFSLLFLELSGYFVNAVQLHVNAADALVRLGVDRDGSRSLPICTLVPADRLGRLREQNGALCARRAMVDRRPLP